MLLHNCTVYQGMFLSVVSFLIIDLNIIKQTAKSTEILLKKKWAKWLASK